MKKLFLILLLPLTIIANEITPITDKAAFDWWTNRTKPVLIIVTSQWCMQCKQLKSWIIKRDFKEVTFLTMDSSLARRFNAGPIKSLPTVIAYKKGKRLFGRPAAVGPVIKDSITRALTYEEKKDDAS